MNEDRKVSLTLIDFVLDAHKAQVDKAGNDYVEHLVGVAKLVPSHLTAVALAHDILEDTNMTVEDLKKAGLVDWEIETIERLTLRKGQRRYDYLRAIKEHQDAACVKIADVVNNVSRLHLIKDEIERERLTHKYIKTLEVLVNSL